MTRAIFGLFAIVGIVGGLSPALAADYREARIPPVKNPLSYNYGIHPSLRSSVGITKPSEDSTRLLSLDQERQLLLASAVWERKQERSFDYGLRDLGDQYQDFEASRQRFQQLVGMMRSFQGSQIRESFDEADRQGRVSRPMVLAGSLVATYFGNPFRHGIGRGLEIRGFTNVPSRTGELGLHSPQVGEWGLRYDPESLLKISSKLGLSAAGLSTQFDYGSHDKTFLAQVTRPLTSMLSATVGARMPVDSESTLVSAQGLASLNFGTSF